MRNSRGRPAERAGVAAAPRGARGHRRGLGRGVRGDRARGGADAAAAAGPDLPLGAGRERDRRGHVGRRAEPVPRRLELAVGGPVARRDDGAPAGRPAGPDRERRGVARGRARRTRASASGSARPPERRSSSAASRGATSSVEMAKGAPLPDRVEERLAEITELVATAIASSATREQLARLADEQAALRRVATLVARGAPPDEVFDAVAEELGRLLDVALLGPGPLRGRATPPGSSPAGAGSARSSRRRPAADRRRNVITEIARTGEPARWTTRRAASARSRTTRATWTRTSIGGPIAGRRAALGRHDRGDRSTAARCRRIPSRGSRSSASWSAPRSPTPRRASSSPASRTSRPRCGASRRSWPRRRRRVELFAQGRRGGGGRASARIESAILRYEADETATVLAGSSAPGPGGIRVGARLPLDGGSVTARVFRERRAVRVGRLRRRGRRRSPTTPASTRSRPRSAARSSSGPPVGRDGRRPSRAASRSRPAPSGASRSSPSSSPRRSPTREARAELQRLADEQAALRRVATLVAEAAAPDRGVRRRRSRRSRSCSARRRSGMVRAESADEVTSSPTAGRTRRSCASACACRSTGDSVTARVLRTGRSARINLDEEGRGAIAELARRAQRQRHGRRADHGRGPALGRDHRELGAARARRPATPSSAWRSSRSCSTPRSPTPTAAISSPRPAPACSPRPTRRAGGSCATSTTAPSSAWSTRSSRSSSRSARSAADTEQARSLLAEALDHAETEQRRAARAGPRDPAVGPDPRRPGRRRRRRRRRGSTSRSCAEITSARLPPEIEASAYFIVAEALTNVVKHSQATRAEVTRDRRRTGRCDSRCATTASAGPTRRATGCWASATARPRSAAGCASTALAAGARCSTADAAAFPRLTGRRGKAGWTSGWALAVQTRTCEARMMSVRWG